jgi:hypothetical protein
MKEYLLSSLTKAGHIFVNEIWLNGDKPKIFKVRMIIETIVSLLSNSDYLLYYVTNKFSNQNFGSLKMLAHF